jgi:uroporphyrinogen decarboxylase
MIMNGRFPHIPLEHARPDAGQFVDALLGRCTVHRAPLVEYIVDDVVMRPILEQMLGRPWTPWGTSRPEMSKYLDNVIAFWKGMGYDFVRFELGLPLPAHLTVRAENASGAVKERAWADEHHGAITSWEEFERYPWPRVEEFDFFPFEYLNTHLPEGMGLISSHGGGVFEHLSWIMSLEGLCTALYEAPDLVRAIAARLGHLMARFYSHLLDLDRLIVVFPGDDMGYKSATMVSPRDLRTYVLPWHKQFAAMAHARSKPYFLHSCGNIVAIMDDLMHDVGIDGKHSYEDAIIPAPEFQRRYGDRVAVLGGVDLNILAGKPPVEVRARVRELIQTCGPVGRYAIGSGNSVPSYVPVDNYLAMIDEAHAVSY